MDQNVKKFISISCKLTGTSSPDESLEDGSFLNDWDQDRQLTLQLGNFLKYEFCIQRKEFNQLMILLGCTPVSEQFFSNVFKGSIKSMKEYEEKVERFRIQAARKFGNFKYAYRFFAGVRLPRVDQALGLEEDPGKVWEQLTEESTNIRRFPL